MKLSNDTREVLKNYASINANLLVTTGNTIATMSQMKNIVSTATVPDTFDSDFAIYDLNEFLSALSLFNDPELTFNEQSVRIAQGRRLLIIIVHLIRVRIYCLRLELEVSPYPTKSLTNTENKTKF